MKSMRFVGKTVAALFAVAMISVVLAGCNKGKHGEHPSGGEHPAKSEHPASEHPTEHPSK